jgi:hypothetical protein
MFSFLLLVSETWTGKMKEDVRFDRSIVQFCVFAKRSRAESAVLSSLDIKTCWLSFPITLRLFQRGQCLISVNSAADDMNRREIRRHA